MSSFGLFPAISASIALASSLASYLGITSSPTPNKQYTLIPPLFEQRLNRLESLQSPQSHWKYHTQLLLHNYYNEDQLLSANLRLQPQQAVGGHDVEAIFALPSVSLFSSAPSSSSSSSPLSNVINVSAPTANFIARLQPSPFDSTFVEARLSTVRGGRANLDACYEVPLFLLNRINRQSSSSLTTAAKDAVNSVKQAAANAASNAASSLTKKRTYSLAQAAPSSSARFLVFAHAPLFEGQDNSLVETIPTLNSTVHSSDDLDVGLRVDHLNSSLGLKIHPLQSETVRGWLTSATPVSDLGHAVVRGGVEFQASTLFDRTPEFQASVYYTQASPSANKENHYDLNAPPEYQIGLEARKGGEELTASFFNHQTVRRLIRNPMEEKQVKQIVNYLQLALELNLARNKAPSWQTGLSFQANKNIMIKTRLSDQNASAALCFRSWWSPSISLSLAAHRQHSTGAVDVGVSLSVENLNSVVFGQAPINYHRTVNTRRIDVTREAASPDY